MSKRRRTGGGVRRNRTIGRNDPKKSRRVKFKTLLVYLETTQRAIALRAQMPESRLSDIVCSRGAPVTKEEKLRIARAMGVPVGDLFPGRLAAAA